jgi:3-hydroxyisobutyrate dehydrogenase
MRIAFIGAGAIGQPMAERLIPLHKVTVFDVVRERVEKLVAQGAFPAASASGAASGADVVIVIVATPAQLGDAVFGADGVAAGIDSGATLIVMSSVGVDAVREVERRLRPQGVQVLDVPVTGGVARAITGELTLLAGGDAATLEHVREVLEKLGTTIASCGPRVGDGQAVKLVNQLLCSIHLAAAGEALNFASALGLNPASVLEVLGSGAASSFMLLDRGPRMLSNRPAPVLSSIDIFVKDSSLVAQAAANHAAAVPLLQTAAELFRRASTEGRGGLDDSSVYDVFTTS